MILHSAALTSQHNQTSSFSGQLRHANNIRTLMFFSLCGLEGPCTISFEFFENLNTWWTLFVYVRPKILATRMPPPSHCPTTATCSISVSLNRVPFPVRCLAIACPNTWTATLKRRMIVTRSRVLETRIYIDSKIQFDSIAAAQTQEQRIAALQRSTTVTHFPLKE